MKKFFGIMFFVFSVLIVGALFCQSVAKETGVKTFKDLVYTKHGDREMKLDLYVPESESEKGPYPLIVWIHGGGWIGGSKDDCPPKNAKYCQNGYATASVAYRFSDVAPFPAQIQDVKAAIRWLRAHAKEYDLDPNRIGVWGGSAGGHLACLLGVTGQNKVFDVGENLDQSSEVQAVCNWFGPTNIETLFDRLDPQNDITKAVRKMVDSCLGGPLDEKKELAKQASPVTHVDAKSAPFLHVHGTVDLLVPVEQAEELHDKLRQANVESRLFLIPRGGHGDGDFWNPKLFEEIRLFMDKHLK